jgi:hypothetical protein
LIDCGSVSLKNFHGIGSVFACDHVAEAFEEDVEFIFFKEGFEVGLFGRHDIKKEKE